MKMEDPILESYVGVYLRQMGISRDTWIKKLVETALIPQNPRIYPVWLCSPGDPQGSKWLLEAMRRMSGEALGLVTVVSSVYGTEDHVFTFSLPVRRARVYHYAAPAIIATTQEQGDIAYQKILDAAQAANLKVLMVPGPVMERHQVTGDWIYFEPAWLLAALDFAVSQFEKTPYRFVPKFVRWLQGHDGSMYALVGQFDWHEQQHSRHGYLAVGLYRQQDYVSMRARGMVLPQVSNATLYIQIGFDNNEAEWIDCLNRAGDEWIWHDPLLTACLEQVLEIVAQAGAQRLEGDPLVFSQMSHADATKPVLKKLGFTYEGNTFVKEFSS